MFANQCATRYQLPVKMLYFKRLQDALTLYQIDLGVIEMIPLLAYKEYLDTVYHSRFLISDSGTGQEEPALLHTPVIVPRDFTERPQSYQYNCSIQLNANQLNSEEVFQWLEDDTVHIDASWLGDGQTSHLIIEKIQEFLQ
jgi:UDP-N-acetylglucosamine 2-epimerase (non-hydrolysing)